MGRKQEENGMELHLLEGRKCGGYVTFGGVWKKGEVKGSSRKDGILAFRLYNEEGTEIPVQSKVLAYWPDGSIKWSGHTADSGKMGKQVTLVAGEEQSGMCQMREETEKAQGETGEEQEGIEKEQEKIAGEKQKAGVSKEDCLEVTEEKTMWKVFNGRMSFIIPKVLEGSEIREPLIKELCLDEKVIAREGYTVFSLEHRQIGEKDTRITTDREYQGLIEQVTMERPGPLQAVFCYKGKHVTGEEAGMPFVIRLSVGAGDCELKLVHTFLFDGEEKRDYLKGMGIRFQMPMEGTPVNHHIQFAGENKVFHEAAVMLNCNYPKLPPEIYQRQMRGEYIEDEEHENVREARENVPVWNRYRLIQDSAYHFAIRKNTKKECCELTCRQGSRAKGVMAVSGKQGGFVLGIRDFWQKYPGELEVEKLGTDEAAATAWFYSPAAEAYDFRHYDTRSYPRSCYEGFEEVGASAVGIGVTSECRIGLWGSVPKEAELLSFADRVQKPGVYVASPEYYHEQRAFGYWSLKAERSEKERWLEKQLDSVFAFYKQEVENRDWYGLFDYGDVMHSYDRVRHTWKYDLGGMAWQNTELVDTYWLWLYFLRTGREDVFTLAEAMSRHCSEVDVYHFGPLKGLGSRHNVRHWGCSCKEPRISMAGHHRFLYYLTGDERLGDVMEDVKDADLSMSKFPYAQAQLPDGTMCPAARSGPDWSSYVSDWMTHYERTLEDRYRERIERGTRDIAAAPFGLMSGPDYLYDPSDGHLSYNGEREDTPNQHLQICMGGPQVWLETADMLEDDTLKKLLADLGSVYYLTPEERSRLTEGKVYKRPFSWPFMAAGVTAFSAFYKKDATLAHKTWEVLFSEWKSKTSGEGVKETAYGSPESHNTCMELPWISTNTASQWGLNVIMSLEFIREYLE